MGGKLEEDDKINYCPSPLMIAKNVDSDIQDILIEVGIPLITIKTL